MRDIGYPDGGHVAAHLPPAVIQHIVRESYKTFQACYEDGLRRDADLKGRVTVRFVIDRDGVVSNVSNGGSDMPDVQVVRCVMKRYYDLCFPPPEGNGIVTVVYPIMFTPGD